MFAADISTSVQINDLDKATHLNLFSWKTFTTDVTLSVLKQKFFIIRV